MASKKELKKLNGRLLKRAKKAVNQKMVSKWRSELRPVARGIGMHVIDQFYLENLVDESFAAGFLEAFHGNKKSAEKELRKKRIMPTAVETAKYGIDEDYCVEFAKKFKGKRKDFINALKKEGKQSLAIAIGHFEKYGEAPDMEYD
ncbi:MAG: hypothetical protein HY394_01915 [Candidatus Diapherotrites archaeon]|nr:hypothetical protein [Candidatus Diapherotrites archaeon]